MNENAKACLGGSLTDKERSGSQSQSNKSTKVGLEEAMTMKTYTDFFPGRVYIMFRSQA